MFGGVAVGCVGRNTVLLDLILSLGVRRQHTLVFLNRNHAIPTVFADAIYAAEVLKKEGGSGLHRHG